MRRAWPGNPNPPVNRDAKGVSHTSPGATAWERGLKHLMQANGLLQPCFKPPELDGHRVAVP
jgi:hypothetical protein